MKGYFRGILERNLERILQRTAYTTKREQALVLELAHVRDQLGAAMAAAEERLALLTASAALAEERVVLLAAAAARAEDATARAASAEKQRDQEREEHAPRANRIIRLELRVQALQRRRDRLQAELHKLQDQLARADVSGRIRDLQEENAQLQQRLADLQTYFSVRVEPPHGAANGAGENQGSANPR